MDARAGIAGARKVTGEGPLANTPVGRLSDLQWGWVVTAAIFAWTRVRSEQAIADGRDQERMILATGLSPDPRDIAVVSSVLGELADTAGIDWDLPLKAWPKDTMLNFLSLAWALIRKAEQLRDRAPATVLREPQVADDAIPF